MWVSLNKQNDGFNGKTNSKVSKQLTHLDIITVKETNIYRAPKRTFAKLKIYRLSHAHKKLSREHEIRF